MEKPKLSLDGQVEHMKRKSGIQFNIVKEEEAKQFLSKNNYYFKLKSYSKNYEKYNIGENKEKYINLEFAYLMELSKIDMYFRKFVLKMALDVEHFLKLQMLSDFMGNEKEDGYRIIEELFVASPFIKVNIERKKKYSACADLISKLDEKFAIWNIVEIISFGDFIKLYDLYYNKYKSERSMARYLQSIKFLRNAAAHNTCLLNSLKNPYNVRIIPNAKINNFVSKIPGIKPGTRKKKMQNPVIHDLIVMLYVFNQIVTSESIKKHTIFELKELIDCRMVKNKEYFQKNELIKSYYKFTKKIVDYYYSLSV